MREFERDSSSTIDDNSCKDSGCSDDNSSEDSSYCSESFPLPDDHSPEDSYECSKRNHEDRDTVSFHHDSDLAIPKDPNNCTGTVLLDSQDNYHRCVVHTEKNTDSTLSSDTDSISSNDSTEIIWYFGNEGMTDDRSANYEPIPVNLLATNVELSSGSQFENLEYDTEKCLASLVKNIKVPTEVAVSTETPSDGISPEAVKEMYVGGLHTNDNRSVVHTEKIETSTSSNNTGSTSSNNGTESAWDLENEGIKDRPVNHESIPVNLLATDVEWSYLLQSENVVRGDRSSEFWDLESTSDERFASLARDIQIPLDVAQSIRMPSDGISQVTVEEVYSGLLNHQRILTRERNNLWMEARSPFIQQDHSAVDGSATSSIIVTATVQDWVDVASRRLENLLLAETSSQFLKVLAADPSTQQDDPAATHSATVGPCTSDTDEEFVVSSGSSGESVSRRMTSSTNYELPQTHCSKQKKRKLSERSSTTEIDSKKAEECPLHEIVTSLPLVSTLNNDKIKSHCSYCFRKLKNKIECLQCKFCCYCNEMCQVYYSRLHRFECGLFQKGRYPSAFVRTLAHLYWLYQNKDEDVRLNFINTPHVRFLCTKSYTVKQSFIKLELLDFFEGTYDISVRLFNHLYPKFLRCYLVIKDFEDELGIGMYPTLANVEHSCKPNANVIFLRNRMEIIRLPSSDKHEPYRINYVDVMNCTYERSEKLLPINGDFCHCEYCQDIELEKSLTENFVGLSFQKLLDNKIVLKAVQLTQDLKVLREKDFEGEEIPENICNCLEDMNQVLGPFNCLREKILVSVAHSCRGQKSLLRERIYCYEELGKIYKYVLGLHNTKTIRTIVQLALLLSKVGNRDGAEQCFMEAVEAATEAYGGSHWYTLKILEEFERYS